MELMKSTAEFISRLVYSIYSLMAWSICPLLLRIFHLRKCFLKSSLFSSTIGISFAGAASYGLLGSFFSSATIFSSLAIWVLSLSFELLCSFIVEESLLKTIHDSFQYISFSVTLHQLLVGGTSQSKQ